MNSNRSRQGVSLIIVLILMITATLMATALFVALSRHNSKSGEQLYTESALAATKAGTQAAQAWFNYEGQSAKNLLDKFLDTSSTYGNPGRKPIRINISNIAANFKADSTTFGQTFEVFLTDVLADSSATNNPISVKLQIIGTGQDSSKAISTVILNLKGIGYQKADSVTTLGGATMPIEDAIYVGGSFTGDNNVKTSGSAYFDSITNLKLGDSIDGNLVIGSASNCASVEGTSSGMTITGDFYSGTAVKLNSTTIVKGNAYLDKGICGSGNYPITFYQDAVFNGSVFLSMGTHLFWIKGNSYFDDSLSWTGNSVEIDGDAGFGSNSYVVIGNTNSSPSLFLYGNTNIYGTITSVYDKKATFGNSASDWAHIYSVSPLSDSTYFTFTGAHYIGGTSFWGTDTSLTSPDQLTTIRSQLDASGKKESPISIDTAQLSLYRKTFNTLLTKYSVCNYNNSYLYPRVFECFYDSVSSSEKMNNYLALDLEQQQIQFSTVVSPTLGGDTLTQKYILIDPGSNSTIATSSTSRIILYYETPGTYKINPKTANDTCYCLIFLDSGVTLQTDNPVWTIHGAIVAASGANFEAKSTYTIVYDNTILTELATSGALQDTSGTNLATSSGTTYQAPYTVSLLSPRLQAALTAQSYGDAVVDTADALNFGKTLYFAPAMVAVTEDDYTSWNACSSAVHLTAYSPGDTVISLTREFSNVLLDSADSYQVRYKAVLKSGDTATAILPVWVKPTGVTTVATSSATGTSSTTTTSSTTVSSSSVAVSSSSFITVSSTSNYCTTNKLFYNGDVAIGIWNSSSSGNSLEWHEESSLDSVGKIIAPYYVANTAIDGTKSFLDAYELGTTYNLNGGSLKFYFYAALGSSGYIFFKDVYGKYSDTANFISTSADLNSVNIAAYAGSNGFTARYVTTLYFYFPDLSTQQTSYLDSIYFACDYASSSSMSSSDTNSSSSTASSSSEVSSGSSSSTESSSAAACTLTGDATQLTDGTYTVTYSTSTCYNTKVGMACSDGDCSVTMGSSDYSPGWWYDTSLPSSGFTLTVTGGGVSIKCW